MPLLALGAAGDRTAWTVQDGDRSFAVFVVGGRCYVTDARCPHNGGPLAQGWIRHDAVLTCPWHWYRFDLDTGRSLNPGGYQLGCYPVVERDGELYAEVPEAAPARSWAQVLRAHARGEDGPGQAVGAEEPAGPAAAVKNLRGRASGAGDQPR